MLWPRKAGSANSEPQNVTYLLEALSGDLKAQKYRATRKAKKQT